MKKDKDDCNEDIEYDKIEEILGMGSFAIEKPQLPKNQYMEKEDYFMREINTFNQKEFNKSKNSHEVKKKNEKRKLKEVIQKENYRESKQSRQEKKAEVKEEKVKENLNQGEISLRKEAHVPSLDIKNKNTENSNDKIGKRRYQRNTRK